jgi:hypothetical protein
MLLLLNVAVDMTMREHGTKKYLLLFFNNIIFIIMFANNSIDCEVTFKILRKRRAMPEFELVG